MRTVFYLSEKEVSKAIQEYVLNTLRYYGNEKSHERPGQRTGLS